MAAFLPTLARMTLTGSLVILAVLVSRLCLRRAPRKLVCLLWLAVLFRLLCPVTLHAPTSVVPEKLESGEAVENWSSSYVAGTQIIREDADTERFRAAVDAGRSVEHPTVFQSVPPGDYVVTAADGVSPPQTKGETWLPILGWVWLAGAAGLLLWSAFKYLRLRLRLREAVKLEKGVYEAEGLDSPFVLGVLRPRVYLPWGMEGEEQRWVLLHERAHVHRMDPLWKLLGWLALCLHWFNPLCWLAFSLAMQDMEGACDEAVVRTLGGEERAAYSRLLLALSAGRPLFAATPLGFGEGNVKKRIQSVLRWRKPGRWMAALAVLLLAAVVLLFVLGPRIRGKELQPLESPEVWPQRSFFTLPWTEVAAGQRGVWPVEDGKRLKKELAKLLEEGTWHIGGIDATGADRDAGGRIVIDWNQYMPGKLRWVSGGEQWELYVGKSFLGLTRNGEYAWLGNAVVESDSPYLAYMGDTARMEAILALTERGEPPFILTPEEDLTLCGIPWGAAMEDAKKLLPTASEGDRCLIVNDASLCGFRTDAVFDFGEDEGGTFLLGVTLTFREEPESFSQERFDRKVLCEELSKVWGERWVSLPDPQQTLIDDWGVPERLWYWITEDFSDEMQWLCGVVAWFERKAEPRTLYLDASGRNLASGRQLKLAKNKVTMREASRLLERLSEQASADWTKVAQGGTLRSGKYDALEIRVSTEEDFRLLSERLAAIPWFTVVQGEASPEPEPTPEPAPTPTPEPTAYPVEEGWTLLTKEELYQAELALTPISFHEDEETGEETMWVNPVDPCFTSYYTDPRDLDFYAFMRYFGIGDPTVVPASEEEFRALRDAGYLVNDPWLHVEDLPVPLTRIPASTVEAALRLYFDIGLTDLHQDYRIGCLYLPETDCFYSTTSDFGPGAFFPEWGERKDDLVRLWVRDTCLTCRKLEDRWIIVSFLQEGTATAAGEGSAEPLAVQLPRGRRLRPETAFVFLPADTEALTEPEGEPAAFFRGGTRLILDEEYLTGEGELWLLVREETDRKNAAQGWIPLSAAEAWTEELEAETLSPVWFPEGTIFYPIGSGASDAPEDWVTEANANTRSRYFIGSILETRGDYARVDIGSLEVWVLREVLTVGTPLVLPDRPELTYFRRGRMFAEALGHPLAAWGAELVWHRGREEGEGHYTAYFPTTDGSGTVCAVFPPEGIYTPKETLLIPPGAEDWP